MQKMNAPEVSSDADVSSHYTDSKTSVMRRRNKKTEGGTCLLQSDGVRPVVLLG